MEKWLGGKSCLTGCKGYFRYCSIILVETYFNIRFEFDRNQILESINRQLKEKEAGYICVADGNILNVVNRDRNYREVVNNGMFSICDSSYIPLFLKWIHGIERTHYTGSDIFQEIISADNHKMFFLGTSLKILGALKTQLRKINPHIDDMRFEELPYRDIDSFDYENIAKMINEDGSDIIWVSLGAPKQEYFMSRLKPHLTRGVMIAVGAAFKFFSGLDENRAPKWMRDRHLEFVYRLFIQPQKQFPRIYGLITKLPSIIVCEYKRRKQVASANAAVERSVR